MLEWEQAQAGRELKVRKKDQLPLLLKAEANDASVTEIDLENEGLTDKDGVWLGKMLSSNTHVVKIKCVSSGWGSCA